jgi:hypothetical protein
MEFQPYSNVAWWKMDSFRMVDLGCWYRGGIIGERAS